MPREETRCHDISRRIRARQRERGGAGRVPELPAATSRCVVDEADVGAAVEALRSGGFSEADIEVFCGGEGDTQRRVADVLTAHGGHFINYYGGNTVEASRFRRRDGLGAEADDRRRLPQLKREGSRA